MRGSRKKNGGNKHKNRERSHIKFFYSNYFAPRDSAFMGEAHEKEIIKKNKAKTTCKRGLKKTDFFPFDLSKKEEDKKRAAKA